MHISLIKKNQSQIKLLIRNEINKRGKKIKIKNDTSDIYDSHVWRIVIIFSSSPVSALSISIWGVPLRSTVYVSRWLRSRRFERFRCSWDSLVGWISHAEVISHGFAYSSRSLAIYIQIESLFFLIIVCDYLDLLIRLIQFFWWIESFEPAVSLGC